MKSLLTAIALRLRRALPRSTGYLGLIVLMGLAACGQIRNEPPSADPAAPSPGPPVNIPPPPPTHAFLALMTPDQTAAIRALDVPLVLPTQIPDGFTVAQVYTQREPSATSYQVVYRDRRDRCFLIEHTSENISDVPTIAERTPLDLPILGNTASEFGLYHQAKIDLTAQSNGEVSALLSDWLPIENGFYRFAGATVINANLETQPPCQNVDVEEAVAIVQSLALITDEIQGDGPPQ